jgi:hypothetical protein
LWFDAKADRPCADVPGPGEAVVVLRLRTAEIADEIHIGRLQITAVGVARLRTAEIFPDTAEVIQRLLKLRWCCD